jgi:hypothetical protein
MRILSVALMFLFMFAMAGCEHSAVFEFQIVDAQTGKGLDTVKVEAMLSGHHYSMHALPAEDDVDAMVTARTDAQGRMSLNLKTEVDLRYYVFLTRRGYQALTGEIFPFTGRCDLTRRPGDTLPAMGAPHDLPEIHMASGKVTVIPMERLEKGGGER